MLRPDELLSDLRAAGLTVSLRGDRLAIAPRSKLTGSMIRELRRQKPALLALLAAEEANAVKVEPPPLSPLEALEAAQRAKVEEMLNGPPCSCGSCQRSDAEVRFRREDRWYH